MLKDWSVTMEHDKSIPLNRVYEKPALTPVGHMAQVTQKSGPNPDASPEFPTEQGG